MRIPKGFGKNYFSLSAICAYSSTKTLQAQCTTLTKCSRNLSFNMLEETEELLEEEEFLLEALLLNDLISSFLCKDYSLKFFNSIFIKFKKITFILSTFIKHNHLPPITNIYNFKHRFFSP